MTADSTGILSLLCITSSHCFPSNYLFLILLIPRSLGSPTRVLPLPYLSIFPKPLVCQPFLLNIYRIEFLLLNPLLIFLNCCKSFEPCFSFSLYLLSGRTVQCSQDWEGRLSVHPLRTHVPCLLHVLPFHSIPSLLQNLFFSSCPVHHQQPSPIHSANYCQVWTSYTCEDLVRTFHDCHHAANCCQVWTSYKCDCEDLSGLSMTVTMLPTVTRSSFQLSLRNAMLYGASVFLPSPPQQWGVSPYAHWHHDSTSVTASAHCSTAANLIFPLCCEHPEIKCLMANLLESRTMPGQWEISCSELQCMWCDHSIHCLQSFWFLKATNL